MNLRAVIVAVGLAALLHTANAQPLQEAVAALQRKDCATAVALLQPLARAGDPVAQWRLGLLHHRGQGVPEDDRQAQVWFEKAAQQGLADAQFELANLLLYGLAPPPAGADPARLAAQWFFAAAAQGHAQAQYSLGILFLTGSGVQVSADEATKWIGRAAAQGHVDAQAYLRALPPRR